jgi:hypothetical protein
MSTRKILIESKMEVLEHLQVHINKELETYRAMLQEELTPIDEGYTGAQEQS